jgi:hypothetical protein
VLLILFQIVTSNSWSILNVQAKCDLVTIDNSFEESFYKSISEGKPLNINYNTLLRWLKKSEYKKKMKINWDEKEKTA